MRLNRLNDLVWKGRRVQGKWLLDRRHQLRYRADEDGKTLAFETSLMAAEAGALVLGLTAQEEDGRSVTRLARLTGTWFANARNQIVFEVERESGRRDVLVFRGSWKAAETQELIYTWRAEKAAPGGGRNSLVFRGWWDIREKNRLTYLLEGAEDEGFRFRAALQTPSVLAKKGQIRYQIGLEGRARRRLKNLVLFGKWKLSDALELSFEMEYADGRRHAIRFGAEFGLPRGWAVAAQLSTPRGRPLGIELVFTREWTENKAQGFVRLKKSLQESAIEAGVSLPW